MTPFRRTAFTLVELLVVIGIIAVLIGILLPSLARARAQATKAQCMSNLRTLGQCLYTYVADNKGRGMFYAYSVAAPPPYATANSYWFGVQASGGGQTTTFLETADFPGYLAKYYKNPQFTSCPAIKPSEEGITKFNLSSLAANMPLTTYAYNSKAGTPVTNPAHPDFGGGAGAPSKCKISAETWGLMDAFTLTVVSGALSMQATYAGNAPTSRGNDQIFHGRHLGYGNVLWYDGHVTSEAPYLLTPAELGATAPTQAIFEMRYKQKLGYLTPYTRSTVAPADLFVGVTGSPPASNFNYYYWADKVRKR